jgi:hypothetical protein
MIRVQDGGWRGLPERLSRAIPTICQGPAMSSKLILRVRAMAGFRSCAALLLIVKRSF